MMNTMSNASTTTPMITPNQTPEIRVRPVGLPADGVVILGGTLGASPGCGVGVSEAGDPSLIQSLAPFGLGPPSLGASVSLRLRPLADRCPRTPGRRDIQAHQIVSRPGSTPTSARDCDSRPQP